MSFAGEDRIDPRAVARLYHEHSSALRAFLIGLLRDPELAEEARQATFAKALESGHTVEASRFRGWLFRVANNEAMLLKRRQGVDRRAIEKLADGPRLRSHAAAEPVVNEVSSLELTRLVRAALKKLPPEQSDVVRMRIFDGLKFAQIAARTGVPLGTVLTRMRLGLGRLSKILPNDLNPT